MTNENIPPQDKSQAQREYAKTQKGAAAYGKGSKLLSFKGDMVLSMKDYKIILCIALVLLILGALRAVYLPMFFFGLFVGGIYTGGEGFMDFIIFLPTFLWALAVIFLPVVLILHFIIDRRLKAMFQQLEKSSEQQNESAVAQTR